MNIKELIGRLIGEADNCDDMAPYDCPNVSTELREAADTLEALNKVYEAAKMVARRSSDITPAHVRTHWKDMGTLKQAIEELEGKG